jgi:hypothetical protein
MFHWIEFSNVELIQLRNLIFDVSQLTLQNWFDFYISQKHTKNYKKFAYSFG